jgi:hypothetical protein
MSSRLVTLMATAMLAGMAYADCPEPTAPARIPDGKTASKEEMVTAMQILKQYDSDVTTYTKCLDFEARQSRLTGERSAHLQETALGNLKAVADKFNAQVRVFKVRTG